MYLLWNPPVGPLSNILINRRLTTKETDHSRDVFGPLLFLAHINDLPTTIQSQCRLFVDDLLLYRPIRSLQDQLILQEDLQHLQHWADNWGMRFNVTKCQLLRIARSQHPLERFYTISDQILQQVPSTKYLGIFPNGQLKWDTHIDIDSITARANSANGFLRRNLSLCTRDLKELAYFYLARSVLENACQVWDPHLTKAVARLEQVQRCAARFTMRDYSIYSSVIKMLNDLGWEPPVYKAPRPSPVADVPDHPGPVVNYTQFGHIWIRFYLKVFIQWNAFQNVNAQYTVISSEISSSNRISSYPRKHVLWDHWHQRDSKSNALLL